MGFLSSLRGKKKSSSSKGSAGPARADVLGDPLGSDALADPLGPAAATKKSRNPFKRLFGRKHESAKGKEHLKDRHVKSKKSLGGGSANDVAKVAYRREIGSSGSKEGYFKADFDRKRQAAALEQTPELTFMGGKGAAVGIDEDDPRNAARSVASTRIDQLLGTDVLSRDTFAKHDGQVGVVSPTVAGHALVDNVYEAKASNFVGPVAARRINLGAGGAYQIEGDQVFSRVCQTYAELDWADPEIQRGMANLGAIDYLTGQLDRHGGNIFVDPATGKVRGIDNDISFGSRYREGFEKSGLDNNHGLPSLIDGDLAERMVMQDADEYERTLRGKKGDFGHLSEPEIEAAMTRFYRLQAYCEELLADPVNPDPRLIYNWDEASLEATLALGDQSTRLKSGTIQKLKKGSILATHKALFETSTNKSDSGSVRKMRRPGEKVA